MTLRQALDAAGMVADKTRVLIVDDNRVNRQLLTALLERAGRFEIENAADGEEALRAMERHPPDILLLDLMMPRLDGFELCRRLRANPAFAEVPVLVQSSLNRPEDRAKAFAAGATDYITKPINVIELMSRIRIHLENRSLVSNLQRYRRRTEEELSLARRMQERLLPDPRRGEPLLGLNIDFDSLFVPTSELGGDLWGYRRLDVHRLLVYVVDFSGHGVGAALNTFRLHAIIQGMEPDGDPSRLLAAVNRRLCALLPTGQFATMLAAVIDVAEGTVRYASAGSTAPILWEDGDGIVEIGDSAGLPLGLLPSAEHPTMERPFPRGARLFLYSDAAIEIPVGDSVNGEEAFFDLATRLLIRNRTHGGLERLAQALTAVGPVEDDLTLVVVRRN
jgi:phosphoserine phosphatase RsbU/P